MIYLDYQATTPLAPEALEAMLPYLGEKFGNPHSAHRFGREAAAAVELARERIAAMFPPAGRLAFTGSATEALNWAIKGVGGPLVTLATEHAAVLDSAAALSAHGERVTVVPVSADGLVDLAAAAEAIGPGTRLVAAMLVNNEIGTIQPIAELAELAHGVGALLLCDAVQGFGRVTVPAGCDLVAITAHKVYGPKGIGALWVRDGVAIEPLIHGGGQEQLGRSGTLSPALCAGFGVAARLLVEQREADAAHVEQLWDDALALLGPAWTINGSIGQRYRGNLNIRREGIDVSRLLSDLRDIAFSSGSACASGSGRPSHVLRALGLSDSEARGSIRLGFGRYTARDELRAAVGRIVEAAQHQLAAA